MFTIFTTTGTHTLLYIYQYYNINYTPPSPPHTHARTLPPQARLCYREATQIHSNVTAPPPSPTSPTPAPPRRKGNNPHPPRTPRI